MILPKKIALALILFLLVQIPTLLFSQSEAIQRIMENLSETQDLQTDFTELIEELELLENNPVNINSNQVEQLHRLFLISEFQLENIKKYIEENDILLSISELLLIEGFLPEHLEMLTPFIVTNPVRKFELPSFKKLTKYGRHDAFFRYQRILEKSAGYEDFLEGSSLNSRYLGTPDKYYLKYKYTYSRQLQFGFTVEKDAGELFFRNHENEVIRTAIGNAFKQGFDFNSFHLYAQDLGLIKQVAVGDYRLLFGQGLTLWTGLSFGKAADPTQLKRFESFIKPYSSATEDGFLRGAAIHIGQKRWSTVFFYSKNKQDATVQTDENGNTSVSTLLYTGFHRTVSELSKKDIVDVELYGGRFKFTANRYSLGFTAFNTNLSKDLISSYSPDNLYDFRGNNLSNFGFDYGFNFWRAHFYGEVSHSSKGGNALLSGVNIPFSSRVHISLLYRNYESDYQNLFAASMSENSSPTNEKGFFAGTSILLTKKFSLQAYADYFSFPWLKYEQDAPSKGLEYRALLLYEHSRTVKMHLKYKYKQKEINTRADTFGEVNYLTDQTKWGWQYQINYRLSDRFDLRNRVEIIKYIEGTDNPSLGYMLYQDINYNSANHKFGSNTRFAVFNTDSYSSAVYAYENDVLYAFSIPAYSGKGVRFYQLLNYDLRKNIKLWFRYSLSYYPNLRLISSGLDEISGSIKSEIKFQLRIKI